MKFLEIMKNNEINELKAYLKNHDANKEVMAQSLIFWAVHLGNLESTKLLIEKGARVNQKDSLGRTPLSIAAFFGFKEIAELLMENNAQIDATVMDRSYNGWDKNIHKDILSLFRDNAWINLYLDDLRDIPDGFMGARTVEEAISIMEKNSIHMLSLDHDLGIDENGNLLPTGYDLVKYICENRIRPANKVYIHTDNVVGRNNMYQTLLEAQRRGFIDGDIEIYH